MEILRVQETGPRSHSQLEAENELEARVLMYIVCHAFSYPDAFPKLIQIFPGLRSRKREAYY